MDYHILLEATGRFEKLAAQKQFNNSTIADALFAAGLIVYPKGDEQRRQQPTLVDNTLAKISVTFNKLVQKYNNLVKKYNGSQDPADERKMKETEAIINSMVGDYGVDVTANTQGNVKIKLHNREYFDRNAKLKRAMAALSAKIQSAVSSYIKKQQHEGVAKATLPLLPRFKLIW